METVAEALGMPKAIAGMRNNCTLVAVKEVSRMEDKKIFDAFYRNGYVDHKGMMNHKWTQAARDLRLELTTIETMFKATDVDGRFLNFKYPTLAEFIRQHKTGVYLLTIHGHALVVRNGKLVDKNFSRLALRRLVRNAWEVKNAPVVVEVRGNQLKTRFASYQVKRKGSATHARFQSMLHYMYENPTVTVKDVLTNTNYTRGDLAFDLKKGIVYYG